MFVMQVSKEFLHIVESQVQTLAFVYLEVVKYTSHNLVFLIIKIISDKNQGFKRSS